MKTLDVELGERSYPILIGTDLLTAGGMLSRHMRGLRALVVTNANVAPLYLDKTLGALGDVQADHLVLADGEQFKTLDTLKLIFDQLLSQKHDRSTTLIALGGGVVGDMTGFAAACYQRGVDFIQVPTTLLAQVDSSVGGKTGVNHPLGKNMIGAFHQPRCVVTDTTTLTTLPLRQLRAGIAEIIKYGLIADLEFFVWLERNIDAVIGLDQDALVYAIEHSCRLKAHIVSADEREGGLRAILNFGHTFGHAIEAAQAYTGWLHGEAVAVGMVMAAQLSAHMKWLEDADVRRIVQLLEKVGLPVMLPPEISGSDLIERMSVDKKAMNGIIRLVLLRRIGRATLTADYDSEQLEKVVAAHR